MEQPMFSLASYHGERKLAWKRICNTFSVVTAPSVNSFKNRLDKHWASQELRYDWEAELSGTGSRSRVEFRVFRVFLPCIPYILNNDMGTEALRLRP